MVKGDTVTMAATELGALLEEAAEAGAKRALARIGLQDEGAAKDVHELRNVLEAWRAAKATALTTVVRLCTTALLAAMVAGLGMAMWTKH